MRITGPTGPSVAAMASAPRAASASGFSLPQPPAAQSAAGSLPLRTVGGIETLIALQGMDDPGERRRHGVRRGRLALDMLEEIKVGLLGGPLSGTVLSRLRTAADMLREETGDSGLDTVLGEISLRVEVELAKAEAARGRAPVISV